MHTETTSGGSSGPACSKRHETVAQLRTLLVTHLLGQMGRLSALVDDRLFQRSGKGGTLDRESEYFLTMRLLRREAEALKASYQAALLQEFDQFFGWHESPRAVQSAEESAGPRRCLALIAKEDFEEDLAVSGMAEKGSRLFAKSLSNLNRRIATLVGHDRVRDRENPMGPQAFCRAFAEALRPLPLDVPTKLLIYKLYDQAVLQGLGDFYGEAERLVHDIVPMLGASSARSPREARGGGLSMNRLAADAGDGSRWGPGNPSPPEGFTDFFGELQEFLDQWRGRIGVHPKLLDTPALPAEDVMAALHALQHASQPAVAGMDEPLKKRLHVHLAAASDLRRPLARREEDVIDMVGMLFDFILEEPYLPGAVRLRLARLQIPVVKVAIMERAFFGLKNHPARLLLNALAQAGMGLDLDQGGRDRAVLKAIDHAVERVLNEFEQNCSMFSSVLDEFMLFVERDAQRSRMVEERTLQSSRSKEQLLLCKRRVAQEIAVRIQGAAVPLPVRSFLFEHWKDVMLLAYLRRDRSTQDWEQSLAVVGNLIDRSHGPAGLMPALPADDSELLQAIQAGLERVSLDPIMVRAILSDLKRWLGGRHTLADRQAVQEGLEIASTGMNAADLGALAEHEGLADLYGGLTAAGLDATVPVPAEALATASGVAPGEWIEFSQPERRVQGKLSWKSQVSDTLVFVNRKGAKVMELSVRELARLFAERTARRIDAVAQPLMDRAVGALLQTLRGTEGQPSPVGSH